jgi:hypothetical protein
VRLQTFTQCSTTHVAFVVIEYLPQPLLMQFVFTHVTLGEGDVNHYCHSKQNYDVQPNSAWISYLCMQNRFMEPLQHAMSRKPYTPPCSLLHCSQSPLTARCVQNNTQSSLLKRCQPFARFKAAPSFTSLQSFQVTAKLVRSYQQHLQSTKRTQSSKWSVSM